MINDRLHDKLQQLAHGELDAREETALRSQIAGNPEAQALLSEYSQMKADLVLLQDVPPDQLSKERLRARLLGEALKPERSAPVWTWLWMPTAAAAMAFVLYFNRTKPLEAPAIVGSGSVAQAQTPPPDKSALTTPFAIAPQASKSVTAAKVASAPINSNVTEDVQPDEPSASLVTNSRHARRHAHPQQADKPTETDSSPGGSLADAASAALNSIANISPKATALADSSDGHSTDSVVVISNNVDADTGAQHATEETASNVLGGG